MRAIILSAGQGRRLLPLTETRPKCLLPLGAHTLLEWQVDALLAGGLATVTVITGYGAAAVESCLAARYPAARVHTLFNPFFEVADNLASCWMARELFAGEVILVNGDTVFAPAILERLLAAAPAPVRLVLDRKPAYDDDDMKVSLDGERVLAVGKTLPPEVVHGESIGMLRFGADGAARFRGAVEAALRDPAGLRRWYLSVIHALAEEGLVAGCDIQGLRWAEVDFPPDVDNARAVVASFGTPDGRG